jgi:D-xylose transport system ATP-binding protein
VHALCGENGAGKSTLIKVLSGYYPHGQFDGRIDLGGVEARFTGVRDAQRAGIAVVHQELALVDSLSAAENVLLGQLPCRGWGIDWPGALAQARKLLAELHADIDPEAPAGELGVGQRQLVEIARALARSSSVLILDEPTAALAEAEVALVLKAVSALRARKIACIYISHKLSEVLSIADRVTVLRDGRVAATMPAAAASLPAIVRHMIGREIAQTFPVRPAESNESSQVRLETVKLSAASRARRGVRLADISLKVQAGEIVGVGGLLGAGRSELLMHLFGLWGKRTAGNVLLCGHAYDNPNPQSSLAKGLVLITEDRKRYGLVPDQSIGANLSLSSLGAVARFGRINETLERRRNDEMLDRLRFRQGAADRPVRELSGGNQQKVVLGRGLLAAPRVILLDEPTRGVDIGARREIYEFIRELAERGLAVLIVSSELAELTGLCNRIHMMREGRLSRAFERSQFDHDLLMSAATT